VSALAVEPDGQVLVLQTGFPAHLHRLNTDGSPDKSFGPGGVVDVDVGSGGDLYPRLALRSDGRMVVAAASSGQTAPATTQVRRYLSDGSPDLSFGSNGEVTLARGGGGLATSVAAQRDGGLLLTTDAGGGAPGIARLSGDGSLDTAFGHGGVARVRVGPSGPRRYVNFAHGFDWRPLTLPDGRIRIPVTVGPANGVTQIGAVGLTASGHADGRFGRRGLALAPRLRVSEGGEWPHSAVVDRHGGVLLAGSTAEGDSLGGEDSSVVRRFRRDGTLDRSFGRHGLVRGTLGPGENFAQHLAMLDDDTLILLEEKFIGKYQSWLGGAVHALNAGYDRDDPTIAIVRGCKGLAIRITDLSALDSVVVRAGGRVIRRTHRKRFRVRLPDGARRASVKATDLAGNTSRVRTRLPRC
jgi:uncharacterized delta-60 repeat protein